MQGRASTTTEEGKREDTAPCSWRWAWASFDATEKTPRSAMLSPGSVLGSPGAVGLNVSLFLRRPDFPPSPLSGFLTATAGRTSRPS